MIYLSPISAGALSVIRSKLPQFGFRLCPSALAGLGTQEEPRFKQGLLRIVLEKRRCTSVKYNGIGTFSGFQLTPASAFFSQENRDGHWCVF